MGAGLDAVEMLARLVVFDATSAERSRAFTDGVRQVASGARRTLTHEPLGTGPGVFRLAGSPSPSCGQGHLPRAHRPEARITEAGLAASNRALDGAGERLAA